MNYQKVYDAIIASLTDRQHAMGFTPESELCEKHRVLPPAICPPKVVSPWVYASPRELYVLRHLLARIHRNKSAVVVSFKKTQDQYFARCSRDVVRTLKSSLLQMLLEDKEATLYAMSDGAYDVTTTSDLIRLRNEIHAIKLELVEAEDELELHASRYTPHFGVRYQPSDRLVDAQTNYFDAIARALNPEETTPGLGTSVLIPNLR